MFEYFIQYFQDILPKTMLEIAIVCYAYAGGIFD